MKLSLQLIVFIPLSTTLAGHFLQVLGVLVALGWHANADTTVKTVGNQDPGLKYSGGWSPIHTSRESSGVNMLTRVGGAHVSYTFEGIGVAVIGDQGPLGTNATVSTYSIDGGPPSTYNIPSSVTEQQFEVKFYDSGSTLSNGQHTLTITNLNEQAWYWFDHLQVTSDVPPPTSPGTTQVSTDVQQSASSGTATTHTSTGSTSSGTTTTPTGSTSSDSTTTPTESGISSGTTTAPTASSTTPISATTSTQAAFAPSKLSVITAGALAGIILGSITLIALFILGALFWLRRRRRRPLHAASISPGSIGEWKVNAVTELPPDVRNLESDEDLMSSRQESVQGYPVPYRVEAFSGSGNLGSRTQQGAMREKDSRNTDFFSNAEQTSGSVPFRVPSAATQTFSPTSAPPSSGTQASSDVTLATQRRRMSTDGGIRIAGGPPGTDDDVDEVDDSMTLPPEYRQY